MPALLFCGLLLAGCAKQEYSAALPAEPEAAASSQVSSAEETTASASETAQTTASAEHTAAGITETTQTSLPQTTASAVTSQTTAASSAAVTKQTAVTSQTTAASAKTTASQTAKTQSAEQKKQAAKEKCDTAFAALQSAQAAVTAAQNALSSAKQKQQAAEQAYQSFAAAHKGDAERYAQGALGFYGAVGADDAVTVLKTAKYASFTKLGAETDATSLANMEKSFAFLRECNQLRAKHGLKALTVTDRLMAVAQSNLNWSDGNVNHSMQFPVGENLSWNYPNPFRGWYDEEKASGGGQYLNIINSDYVTTGFAVCTAGRSGKYSVSHGQVFEFAAEKTFTVDQYEQRFRSYADSFSENAGKLGLLKGDADSAAKLTQKYAAALTQKQAALKSAETAYQQAKQAYDSLC